MKSMNLEWYEYIYIYKFKKRITYFLILLFLCFNYTTIYSLYWVAVTITTDWAWSHLYSILLVFHYVWDNIGAYLVTSWFGRGSYDYDILNKYCQSMRILKEEKTVAVFTTSPCCLVIYKTMTIQKIQLKLLE